MKYTCPKCKQGFDKAINKHCPLCDTLLVSKRAFIDGKLKFWYELPGSQSVSTTPESASSSTNTETTLVHSSSEKVYVTVPKFPVRLTEPGQMPVVIQSGENEFDVYFQHMMYTGMIYCPKCQSPAFQNMQLFGDLEHWCDQRSQGKSCKAKTTYHFNDPNDVEVN